MSYFVFQSLKAHVPLIKFRKGQLPAPVVTDSFGETYQEIKSTNEQGKVWSYLQFFTIICLKLGLLYQLQLQLGSRYPECNSDVISDRRCLENESQTLESRYPEFRTNETLLYNLLYC